MKQIPRLNKINDGKRIFYNPTIEEMKVFHNIQKEVKGKYNIHFHSRDLIIKQLIATITDGDYTNFSIEKINLLIIRSDIKNFYPGINKHELYRKISNGNILSKHSLDILKPMFFSNSVSGIPLGLPFSSALAEIYLEYFDSDIFSEFLPTFYFRYVDDIIIVKYDSYVSQDESLQLEKLKSIFKKHHLKINVNKTSIVKYMPKSNITEISFQFLGYNFNTINHKLIIEISDEKLKKIIDNIGRFFYVFKKSNRSKKQFWALYYKLKNSIYGVTSLDENNRKMRFGLGFSYKYVNNKAQIENLVKTIKKMIFSCNLPSYETATLLHIITCEDPIKLLKRRYDYTSLTFKQLAVLKKRLNLQTDSNNLSRIFYSIYK